MTLLSSFARSSSSAVFIWGVLACTDAQGQKLTPEEVECGTFSQISRLTPEDYRRPSQRLKVVEDYHFGPMTEALVRPMQRGMTIGSDLDYTLWGYPNHHRALVALVRLGARERTDRPSGTQFTIDCYFRRALRIASNDLIVRMLYANYLGSVNRKPYALRQMAYVVETAEGNPLTHYNAGLTYLELGAFPEALRQAHQASALGYGAPELEAELKRRGKWADPPAAPSAGASSPAVQAAPGASSP